MPVLPMRGLFAVALLASRDAPSCAKARGLPPSRPGRPQHDPAGERDSDARDAQVILPRCDPRRHWAAVSWAHVCSMPQAMGYFRRRAGQGRDQPRRSGQPPACAHRLRRGLAGLQLLALCGRDHRIRNVPAGSLNKAGREPARLAHRPAVAIAPGPRRRKAHFVKCGVPAPYAVDRGRSRQLAAVNDARCCRHPQDRTRAGCCDGKVARSASRPATS